MSETKIINVAFGKSRDATTSARYRYDYGQVIEVVGIYLPETFEARFSNSPHGESIRVIGTRNKVDVPDGLFLTGEPIYCYITVHDEDTDGRTMYSIKIPVKDSTERTDADPTPVEQDVITQAIASLNNAIDRTTENVEITNTNVELTQESATNAQSYAESANSYAENAQASANSANTYAENANDSATNAEASAVRASDSETHVRQMVTEVEQIAQRAETASTNAESSASIATQKATEASTNANIATIKANEASTSATNAQNSADNAQESANSASASASRALVNAEKTQSDKEIVELAKSNVLSAVGEAQNYATTAQSASQAIQDMNVEAITLGVDSDVTVEKTVDPVTGAVTLTYGIPKGVKGEKGDTGSKGNKGDPFVYSDFTPEQLASLKGEKGDKGDKGDQGIQGIQGIQGERGEQGIQGVQGKKGDAFTYADFTPEQLASLKGEKGDKGDAFEYSDFTPQQLASLKGEKGDKGDAFEYSDFTPEQLASLKGEKGDQGIQGVKGDKGDTGTNGINGTDGISPAVSITTIAGGHRITITDTDGQHSADVMDGNDYVLTAQDKADIAGLVDVPVTDSIPTQGSTNAVSSGGVYSALETKADKASLLSGYFTAPIAGTGYISRDDGTVSANVNYWYSDYIDISGCDSLVTKSAYDSAFNAFYDASKAFISAFVVRTGTDLTIDIPANAVYMRVSATKTRYADVNVFKTLDRIKINEIASEVIAITTSVDDLENDIEAINTATASDIGKALKVKTVTDGKVTEWEFGEAGGGGGEDSADLINGYFVPPIEGTGNISREDGSVVTNTSYSHSGYIDISGYDKLTTWSVQGSAFNAFYDANKTFISAFAVASGTDKTIIIPDNAVYMRVSDSTARYNDTFIFKHLSRDNTDKIDGLRDSLAVLADQTIYIPPIAGTGYVAVNDATIPNGDIAPSSSYSHSDYIDISDYDKLYIDGAVYGSSFNAFYNTSKQFISAFSVPIGNSTISIPDNAVYMRVSNPTAKYDTTFRFKPISHANAVRISALESGGGGSTEDTDYFTPEIVSTGYISNNDGSEQSNGNYSRSDYVDISRFGKLITTASYDSAFNAFYTSGKTFISSFIIRTGTDKVVEVPDNAVYMRVSTKTTQYEDSFQFRVLDYVNSVRIDDLEDAVDTLADSIAHSGDTFAPPSVGTGNVSREDGSIVSGSYLHSDYIDISQFPKLLTVAGDGSAFNAFYKADKTFIGSFSIVAGTDKIIEIPDGAMYMRVSGSSSKYANTMKFRTLEYVTSDALPDYWFGHVADKCESIKGHMNAIGRNGDTFAFVTDIHWYSNEQMSPKLIRYLLNHLNINMVALGGDLIRQGTKAEEITESMKCVKAFRFNDTFVPIAFGNHDNNSNQSDPTQRFDASTIYSLFMKGFEDSVTWMTDTEFSFYFDKAANKTRYIFLDMGDDGVSKTFTAFVPFRDALLSTPNGYKIVIVAHIIDYGTFTTSLTHMIDAYNARTSVTVNSVVCDFTSASGSVVICLGGHRHYDDETATAGGVPITVTDCDAMLSTKNSQTAGTITEQAFDVVSLDYINNLAYYERIGRGKSRIINLLSVSASTALSTSLTDTITWSSSDDNIATVSNGTITRVTTGTVIIKADNGTTEEVWVCNS